MYAKSQIIELRKLGKTYKEISLIVGCGESMIGYTLQEAKLTGISQRFSKEFLETVSNYYKLHTQKETSEKFNIDRGTLVKHFGKKGRFTGKRTPEERRKANNKAVTERRRKVKVMAVEYKGGSCQLCGYNKSVDALEFHHLNPAEKEFSVSKTGHSRSWERVKKEIEKCVLVCSNCHREIHAGITKI